MQFELILNHTFRSHEKVFVIDPNGFDLWEGVITSTARGRFKIRFPAFPGTEVDLKLSAHLLVDTPSNREIFNKQDALRKALDAAGVPDSDDADPKPGSLR